MIKFHFHVRNLLVPLVLAVLILGSCKNEEENTFFGSEKIGQQNILFNDISLDTLKLDSVTTSYTGFLEIVGDTIYFIDQRFCWAYLFDPDGKLLSRKMGQGGGPYEIDIKYIDSYCFLEDGGSVFFGSNIDVHLFDNNWKRMNHTVIDWSGEYNYSKIYEVADPSPEEVSVYSPEWEKFKVIADPNSADHVYMPIYSEHPSFNGFVGHDYYKYGRILARVDIEKNRVTHLLGRRSPQYLNYKYLGHHSYFSYDISKNKSFYINHEIDSLIYVYDSDFKILTSFGIAGKDMDTGYRLAEEGIDPKSVQKLYFVDRPKRGYYNEIKLFEDFDLLFRSYKTSSKVEHDGLQIYKGYTLIADVKVPKNFSVKGYIAPWFYSDIMLDEENERMALYQFKLPESVLKNSQ